MDVRIGFSVHKIIENDHTRQLCISKFFFCNAVLSKERNPKKGEVNFKWGVLTPRELCNDVDLQIFFPSVLPI